MERACKNCFHFASVETETQVGVCRLRPPIYDFDATPTGMLEADMLEVYTPVCLNDVCGDFTPKEVETVSDEDKIAELENYNRSLNAIITAQREEIRTLEAIQEAHLKNQDRLVKELKSGRHNQFIDAWKPAEMTVSDPMEGED